MSSLEYSGRDSPAGASRGTMQTARVVGIRQTPQRANERMAWFRYGQWVAPTTYEKQLPTDSNVRSTPTVRSKAPSAWGKVPTTQYTNVSWAS